MKAITDRPYVGYKIDIDKCCDEDYHDENVEWGEWRQSFTNSAPETITKVDKYPDLSSIVDMKFDTDYFLVWVEWSTGDSFGSAVDGEVLTLGIFETKNVADEFALELDTFGDKPWKTITGDGQLFDYSHSQFSCPWGGYFEDNQKFHVSVVRLK